MFSPDGSRKGFAAGPIDARLLPTPSLNLQRIDIARGDEAGSLRARRLSIEFSLGALARGEFRATDVILEGAEISVALDRNGRLEWPAPTIGFDPEFADHIVRLS